MIDHETARRAIATSLDFPLEPDEQAAMDEHLAECPACRSFAAAVHSDAAVLRELDFGPVPIDVRANVAIAAERRGGNPVGRWIAIVAVGALLLVGLGAGALGVGSNRGGDGSDPGPTAGPPQVAWTTDVASLTAGEFAIQAGGQVFRAATPVVSVSSDPGDATYRTLELEWREHGVEQRLYLYFGGDDVTWWVDEIRTRNGAQDAQWLYAKGPFFKTPYGSAWTGDIDIPLVDVDGVGGTPATVHFADLTLATKPADLVNEPPGGAVPLPENSLPFAPGQPLHCSGILTMDPAKAQAVLLSLGYGVSWRHYINDGTYVELLRDPPAGTVIMAEEPIVGSDGQILMPIVAADVPGTVQATEPDDCPKADPNLTPQPPVPIAPSSATP